MKKTIIISSILLIAIVGVVTLELSTKSNRKKSLKRADISKFCPSLLPAPQNLTSTVGDRRVDFVWELGADITDFTLELYRWQTGGLPTLLQKLPSGTTQFEDTDLINGTQYFYMIITKGPNGTRSDSSAQIAVRPEARSSPSDSDLSDAIDVYKEVAELVTFTVYRPTYVPPALYYRTYELLEIPGYSDYPSVDFIYEANGESRLRLIEPSVQDGPGPRTPHDLGSEQSESGLTLHMNTNNEGMYAISVKQNEITICVVVGINLSLDEVKRIAESLQQVY